LKAKALDNEFLGFIPILQEAKETVLADYRALLMSSKTELNLMVKINHAKVVSRIGYVAQDMKDLQAKIYDAIQNRVAEIGTNECLLEAERTWQRSFFEAGDVIVRTAREWKSSNEYLSSEVHETSIFLEISDDVFNDVSIVVA
jgi:hypothetical protein